jgi:myo-inositol 2-dehydrogenase/D-chiro-inositol 1-dehydrogenase
MILSGFVESSDKVEIMEPIRCGLIGFGAWGRHHARAIASVDGAHLAAICARSEQSANAARIDHPQARIYCDYRKMLDSEKLDLCDVVLPSDMHFDVARDVLQSNRHLLLEKPMALTISHCAELVRLAAARSRILAIGHELRFSSLWGKARELIAAGAIGNPLYALIELWRKPYRLGADGWRYDINRVGGWILEEPIHFFDLARWYFQDVGQPVSIYAAANGYRKDHPELHDNFTAIVQFSHGGHATISQTLCGWEHHQTAKITGSDGALWASWSGATDRTFEPTFHMKLRRGEHVEAVAISKPSGEVYELVDQIAAVVEAVRDGSAVRCTGEDGMWSTMMSVKAAESLKTGKAELLNTDSISTGLLM